MACPKCPCPASCPGWPAFCAWAAEDPPDEIKLRHIMARSGCAGPPPVRDGMTAGPRPVGLRKELVVCRYRESLAWLDGVPADFHVSLYDKSDEPHGATRPLRRERLPNVGRESHAMLWHLARHYDSLADRTYFCQGDAPFHAPDFLGRLGVDYEDTCALSETYSPTHPSAAIHASDRVEYHGGFRVAYGDADIDHIGPKPWANPAAWAHVFACPPPRPRWFAYAAMYAVPRARITARPREFWAWLLRESERSPWQRDEWTDPPLTPWQFESLWLYLFSDPAEYPHRPDRVPPTAAEAIGLARRMAACPFRSRDAACGCSGSRCALRGGAPVSHVDCFDCLRRYE